MYSLTLKNDRIIFYNRLGFLILLIHFLYFFSYSLKTGFNANFRDYIPGMLVSAIGLAFNITSALKNKTPLIPFAIVFVATAIVWAIDGNYWLSAAMIILAFLDFNVRKKSTVDFSDDHIEMNVFPKRIFLWEQMVNVILKDRILTLDFKDDRLIQTEIAEESWKIHEGIFNEYCRERLEEVINN